MIRYGSKSLGYVEHNSIKMIGYNSVSYDDPVKKPLPTPSMAQLAMEGVEAFRDAGYARYSRHA